MVVNRKVRVICHRSLTSMSAFGNSRAHIERLERGREGANSHRLAHVCFWATDATKAMPDTSGAERLRMGEETFSPP